MSLTNVYFPGEKIKGDFQADTFFPDYSHFKLLKREEAQEGDYHFEFLELEK